MVLVQALAYIMFLSLKFNLIVGGILFLVVPTFFDLMLFGIKTWTVALPLMTIIYLSYDYEQAMKEVNK